MAEKKKSQKAAYVYVIAGKDKFLVAGECERLLDRLLPVEQRAMALYQPRTEDAELADVLDELRTLPFLAERRVVLLKNADTFISANRQYLEKYFDNPSPCGVLVLTVETWRKNTKLARKLDVVGQLIDVADVKPWELSKLAAEWARSRHQKTFSGRAAALLVELAGDDAGRISSEVEKLAVYVGDSKHITPDDVEKLIGHNRMFNAFAVIDAVTAGDMAGAIDRLRNMFAADRSAEFTVVGAFAYHFRRMFTAKALLAKGMSQQQVARRLGLRGNTGGFFRQLGRMSLENIAAVLCELARIDYWSKTGRASCRIAIEQLVVKLASGIYVYD